MRSKTRVSGQRGGTLVELAMLLPVFTLLLLGMFDVGRGYYYALEVSNAARAGAQYGYQSSGTMIDTTGIQNAATKDALEVGTLSGGTCSTSACWTTGYPQSSWGCMCSDGTSKTPSCGVTLSCSSGHRQVNYLDVKTQAGYKPLLPWPGIPSSVTLDGETLLWAGQ